MTKKLAYVILMVGSVVLAYYLWQNVQGLVTSRYEKLPLQRSYVLIYFLRGENVVSCKRPVIEGQSHFETALYELLKGPNNTEKMTGLMSEIPPTVQLLDLQVNNGIAEVNFNRELEKYGGGTSSVRALIKQIVYTLTAFPEIEKVKFLINGRSGELVLGGDGYIIDHPLTRDDVN
jgi:spore germination protein GerM